MYIQSCATQSHRISLSSRFPTIQFMHRDAIPCLGTHRSSRLARTHPLGTNPCVDHLITTSWTSIHLGFLKHQTLPCPCLTIPDSRCIIQPWTNGLGCNIITFILFDTVVERHFSKEDETLVPCAHIVTRMCHRATRLGLKTEGWLNDYKEKSLFPLLFLLLLARLECSLHHNT